MKTTGEDIFKALENADEHYIEECRQSGSGIKIKTIWTKGRLWRLAVLSLRRRVL